jgi:hypothetical protein
MTEEQSKPNETENDSEVVLSSFYLDKTDKTIKVKKYKTVKGNTAQIRRLPEIVENGKSQIPSSCLPANQTDTLRSADKRTCNI